MEELVVSIRAERRWPFQAALGVSGLWLVAVIINSVAAVPPPLAGILIAMLPPIGLGLIAYALLAGSSRSLPLADLGDRLEAANAVATALEAAINRVDTAAAGTSDKLRGLAATASSEMPAVLANVETLETAAQRIMASSEATATVTATIMASLPEIARTVANVGDTLRDVGGESATQLRAVETMLAAVQARNHEAATQADTAIANMSALMARIDEASARNTAALSKRAYALDAAIDGVLERSSAIVGQINEQVDGQMRSFAAGIDATAKRMALFGDDGARLFNQRLEMLARTSEKLKAEFESHDAGSARLHSAVAERVEDMQRRFAQLDQAGSGAVDEIGARIASFQDRLAAMQYQLEASQAALIGMDETSDRLGSSVTAVQAVLAEKLGDARSAMAALDGEAQQMLDAVASLGRTVHENVAHVENAAGAFASEREAIAGLAAQLATHFDTARATLAHIREGSSAATIEAAEGFAAEMKRVEAAAVEAAAVMRASLAGVVEDAMAALHLAAATGTETAFGAPVRAQLIAIESATERAAETGQELSRRLAAQMLGMVETVAAAEARVGDVETRVAVRERNSLAVQSMRLIGQLETSLVDVARLMELPVSDADWAAHLKGDRNVFANVVAPQLDSEMARRMARLFAHDEAFRAGALAYIHDFEGLIQRLLGDRDGEALAATMLTSDMGKIYVALAAAADRLPPSRG